MTKPISEIIRTRIIESGEGYFANENISDFIEPGELELLQAEVAEKFQGVLQSLGWYYS
jgi:GTP cyclohydrolase I